MTLATCTPDGKPAARIVLLRGFDENGFLFYTNYNSRKGEELLHNPYAALVFYWEPLSRQVRIVGRVEKASDHESDVYFRQRPRGSQVGAWASPQSDVLASREELEGRVADLERQFAGAEFLPRPPFWGGFRVIAHCIEFWQGRPNRLHDRLCYRLESGQWTIERLAP
jgi:pyridoxamine 5'-phosphate oxidase